MQSYLFEKGTASIQGVTKAFVPHAIDPEQPVNWSEVVRETKQLSVDIISGKYGKCTTFCGDGLHKLYNLFLAEATAGANIRGEDFDPKKYMSASARFFQYLQMVLNSPCPYVVFSVWDGLEKDDPDEKGSSPMRHIFPDLPGKSAKLIMGEFSVVLYAYRQGVGQGAKYIWLTQPTGKVWGAGIKMPVEVAAKLPIELPQDFAVLDKYLQL